MFEANLSPSFNVTRASHAVMTARDLDKTQAFYCDVLGLIASDRDKDALYLRALEERSHHSLVFRKTNEAPVCERVGLRVLTEDDLDRAFEHFSLAGLNPKWAERPYQGRTLHVDDPIGTPLEFCATMDDLPTNLQKFELYKGASPMRLDHFQIAAHDVWKATEFYLSIGFRLTEFTATDGKDEIWASWLQRKGNPHDVVFSSGRGPRLHHFAYGVPEIRDVVHVCDVAGSLGFGHHFERGPGPARHRQRVLRLFPRSGRPPRRTVQRALPGDRHQPHAAALGPFQHAALAALGPACAGAVVLRGERLRRQASA